ncbi:VOC family protein [Devosia rhodophyticola]|uniref:VOC family protein n=1 Tax=Devosia rhodophyticola TaxID=3026423 RepID=A0ABY7YZS9_9HYPH|nr:VOC family protein [Devosia rhodophyticola]WDR06739.1 VOC family protein [Devosia rhodophyticola]
MMIDATVQSDIRSAPLLPMTTRLGPVHLAVTDKDRALAIWRDVVGLTVIGDLPDRLELGVDNQTLIVLDTNAQGPVVPHTIGLYHVAIHVPTRADLASMAMRAIEKQVRISPTDHLVSEAIYLWDLDGNGIEITFETPWRGTLGDPKRGYYALTADGKPHSGRERIDLEELLGELGDPAQRQVSMPKGTRIGHVHVHVNDLDVAMGFYRDTIGFGGFVLIHSFGMGDVGLNYMPHTLAFNVWAGPDAKLPPANKAGLRWFNIVVPDAATLAEMVTRLEKAGASVEHLATGIETRDPSGNRLRISATA